MALAPDVSSSTDPNPIESDAPPVNAPGLNYFVFGLFFIFGGITSLNDVLIPKLRELFTLSYTEAMLIQFCFFAAYLLIGIPGAKLVKKIGYMRGAVAGLATMIAGCLLFIPASQTATYALFLGALFILVVNVAELPAAIALIFTDAFTGTAGFGLALEQRGIHGERNRGAEQQRERGGVSGERGGVCWHRCCPPF